MASQYPDMLDHAQVLYITTIDARHQWTTVCRHTVRGVVTGSMAGLAICQYTEESGVYLFGCNADWEVVTDTWHQTIEEAMKQAEFEYAGTEHTWIILQQPS